MTQTIVDYFTWGSPILKCSSIVVVTTCLSGSFVFLVLDRVLYSRILFWLGWLLLGGLVLLVCLDFLPYSDIPADSAPDSYRQLDGEGLASAMIQQFTFAFWKIEAILAGFSFGALFSIPICFHFGRSADQRGTKNGFFIGCAILLMGFILIELLRFDMRLLLSFFDRAAPIP